MLYKLAQVRVDSVRTCEGCYNDRSSNELAWRFQDGFVPKRYFSIDRVFRNEAVDRTHLAEFHQVEGVIFLKNLVFMLHAPCYLSSIKCCTSNPESA